MASRKFVFELWPTLAVALLLLALLALGRWQLERADEKRALLAGIAAASAAQPVAFDAELPRYARVRVTGRWDARQFLLDAQVLRGQVGYRVLTPLALADGSLLIVDRRWVAADADRSTLPDVTLAATEVELEGLLDDFPRPGARLGAAPEMGESWPRVVLYPSAEALAAALDAAVQQRLLRLEADAALAGASGFPPERHQGYAVTWFALAATLVALWLAFSTRARGPAAR